MLGKLDRLVPGNERRERDHATIARRQSRTPPKIAEQSPLPVVFEGRCYRANVVCRYGSFSVCVRRHDFLQRVGMHSKGNTAIVPTTIAALTMKKAFTPMASRCR